MTSQPTTYDPYAGIDRETVAALALSPNAVRTTSPLPVEVHDDNDAMLAAFARAIVDEFDACRAAGRDEVLMIVPVGPVGQYDLLARACTESGRSLDRLTLMIMDEYLTAEGAWIDEADPLSFRRHIREHLTEPMPDDLRPTVIVPDPADPGAVRRTADAMGGVDVCFAGVGVTGHLAFNDPVPGRDDPDWMASLGTRVVDLSPETRLINSVTAARGNVSRMPFRAVTVGMADILSARRLRVFMNRPWQCAAIRRMLFGPVTARFPASLVQRHGNATVDVVRQVLDRPEPGLA